MINEAEPLGYPVVVKNARGHRGERTDGCAAPLTSTEPAPDGSLKFVGRVLMIRTVVLQSGTRLCLHIIHAGQS